MTAVIRRPSGVSAALRAVLLLVGVLWAQELVDQVLFRGRLDALGIAPRSLDGLRGLIFAPFLHVGFAHLIANTVPCLVLGFLIAVRSVARFVSVTVSSALLGGLGVWLVAPAHTLHLGASLLVFGYIGSLLGSGLYERRGSSLLIALLVLAVYGGALWGVLPLSPGVSWQAHLFGFLAGVLTARALAARRT